MIRFGLILIPISTILYILSFAVPFISDKFLYSLILFIIAIILGSLGTIVIFVGVLRDRIKHKKEEDQDDVSKY